MKVLMVNKFFYPFGGPETAFFETTRLLEEHGHEVIPFSMKDPRNLATPYEEYFVENVDYKNLDQYSLSQKLKFSMKLIYSPEAARKIGMLVEKEKT